MVQVDLPFRPDSFVAFVTVHPDEDTQNDKLHEELIKSLQALCDEKLPQYLSPAFIHVLPYINTDQDTEGKDLTESPRESLRRLAQRLFTEKNTVAPRNPIETQIESIWREQVCNLY